MKRQHRTLVVMGIAIVTATIASLAVYRAVQRIPVREVEVASMHVVVAAQALPVGTRIDASHVKVVPWPSRSPVPGSHGGPDGIIGRGLIAPIGENEPVTETKLAPIEAGAGLPPSVPVGMRAISVRVNDVIGVAGFVVPGVKVDLLVTVGGGGKGDAMTRTVVTNARVLAAGTRYDQEKAKDGKPIPTSVVTLMALPEDAERIALATSEGKITLALRNPLDLDATETRGIRLASLMNGTGPEAVVDPRLHRVVSVRRRPVAPPPVAAPYTVETIRAAKRSEEVVR